MKILRSFLIGLVFVLSFSLSVSAFWNVYDDEGNIIVTYPDKDNPLGDDFNEYHEPDSTFLDSSEESFYESVETYDFSVEDSSSSPSLYSSFDNRYYGSSFLDSGFGDASNSVSLYSDSVTVFSSDYDASPYFIDAGDLQAPFIDATVNSLGRVKIYLPISVMNNALSVNSSGIPINVSGSTLTGYVDGSSSNQSISFQNFGVPRYRTNNNYDYIELTNWEIHDTNIPMQSVDSPFTYSNTSDLLQNILLIILIFGSITFVLRLLGGHRR